MRTTGAGQSALLLIDVIEHLGRQEINYAVVGAMAASVYGAVRASMDADAVVPLAVQEAAALDASLKKAGFQTTLRRGDLNDPIAAVLAIHDAFENKVDLLLGLRGLSADAFSRVIIIPFQGTSLRIIGREDFIAMKLFAGGPQDLQDVRRVVAAAKPPIDRDLLERITKGFGRSAIKNLKMVFPS